MQSLAEFAYESLRKRDYWENAALNEDHPCRMTGFAE